MNILSGKARLAGITGWPVSHSRSPRLHGFWLQRYGIDGAYLPLPIHPNDFPTARARPDAVQLRRHQRHHPAQGLRVRDLRLRR